MCMVFTRSAGPDLAVVESPPDGFGLINRHCAKCPSRQSFHRARQRMACLLIEHLTSVARTEQEPPPRIAQQAPDLVRYQPLRPGPGLEMIVIAPAPDPQAVHAQPDVSLRIEQCVRNRGG